MAINTPEPAASGIKTAGKAAGGASAVGTEPANHAPKPITAVSALITVLALAAGLLAFGSWVSVSGLAFALGLVQLALVYSWVVGTALPGRYGALLITSCGAAGADAAALRWYEHGYASALAVVGLSVPALFCHQLSRGAGRARVVESLADISMVLLAAVASSGLLLIRRQADGERTVTAVVVVAAAAMAVAFLLDAVAPAPRFDPDVDRGLPGLIAGIVVGAAVGQLLLAHLIGFDMPRSVMFGTGLALVSCLVSVGMSFAGRHSTPRPSGRMLRIRPIGAALFSLAAVVPVGYVLLGAVAL